MIIQEIIHEIKGIKTDTKSLREFCITFCVILLGISGILFWKGNSSFAYFSMIGLLFLCVGFTFPRLIKYFYLCWISLSFVLGAFVSRVILSLVFYLIFTPIGIVLKLMGKDLLGEKIDKNATSYWKECEKVADSQQYRKPY